MSAIRLRAVIESDSLFLREVYFSTRTEELARVPWTEAQKLAFLEMQFNAQHNYYQDQFSDAAFQIILAQDEPIGRLYVRRSADEIHIIDITVLPQHRRLGIGSTLLKALLDEGMRTNRPVRVSVEEFNPALRLYERLGFQSVGDSGIYKQMTWQPRPEIAVIN